MCFKMVSFRGQKKATPRLVSLGISNKHPCPFYRGVVPRVSTLSHNEVLFR